MKNFKIYIAAFMVLGSIGVSFHSCTKPVYEIGDPVSKLEGINGTWNISAVTQIDEASPLKDELDLSRFFVIPGEPALSLTFTSSDLTYSVIPGSGKNPFGEGGTWAFDDPSYPAYINLYSTAGDTVVVGLGQTIRPTDSQLFLDQQKKCAETAVTTYLYIFDRK